MGCVQSQGSQHYCVLLDDHGTVRLNQVLCAIPGAKGHCMIVFLPGVSGEVMATRWITTEGTTARLLKKMASIPSKRFCYGPHGSLWLSNSLQWVSSDSPYTYQYSYASPVNLAGVLNAQPVIVADEQEASVDLPELGLL